MNTFIEISLLLSITTLITIIVKLLKQPLVVGYILAGVIAGPYFLNLLNSTDELELFSKVGIVFLLFIVGLYLSPKLIHEVGRVSLLASIGQIVITSICGFILSLILGIDFIASMYVAIALTLSSTIIILKLISDKKDLQKLYAKITIGLLLIQDIVASLILILITMFSTKNTGSASSLIMLILFKATALGIFIYLFSHFVLPKLVRYLANSSELLFLFSIAWGTSLASLFYLAGFSIEIGALIAGITLSVTPYANEISSRLKPLRDFFIVVFFILLGSQLAINNLTSLIFPAVVLSLFVLIGNPVILILLMNGLGFNKKTSYMTGLSIAQISEFSLILAAMGLRMGHISTQTLSLITLVGLITITVSTYLIIYSDKLYPKLSGMLRLLELIKSKPAIASGNIENYQSVIFGYDRVGHLFGDALDSIDHSYLVVDFNPQSTQKFQNLNLNYRFGDAADAEFLEDLPLKKPKVIISTVPDHNTNVLLTNYFRAREKTCVIIPIAQTVSEARALYQAGATYVMMPHYLGAHYVAKLIKLNGSNHSAYQLNRQSHIKKFLN